MSNLNSYKKVLLPTTRHNLIVLEAKGFYLTLHNGHKVLHNILDGTSQVGVCPLGHRNPELLKHLREYYSEEDSRPIMLAGQDYYNPYQKELAEKFNKIFPFAKKSGEIKVYYCNSGSEAVENGCLKMAEHYKGGHSFISFLGAFHGRTSLALSMNFSKGIHKERFHFLARTIPIPYPANSGSPLSSQKEDIAKDSIRYIEHIILREGEQNINSVIFEPIQGEGGYIIPHRDFLPMLRELTENYDIPLICDEVQASIRTGKWFSCEHAKIQPDMISVAKAFSGGMSAFAASLIKNRFATKHSGEFAGTFGGSPKDCFIALKTIEIIEKNNYLKNADKQGNYILKNLKHLEDKKIVREIRGKGLMFAVEFQKNKKPDSSLRNKILNHLLNKHKILTEGCGHDEINPSIRFLLPVNTDKEISDRIINSLDESINRFSK